MKRVVEVANKTSHCVQYGNEKDQGCTRSNCPKVEKRTILIRADSASKSSIRPHRGSPTSVATFIASRACMQPITPGTSQQKVVSLQ